MNTPRKEIDWAAFRTLERIGAASPLMHGEVKTLSDDEIDAINAAVRMALTHVEPAVDLLFAARSRYASR